MDILRSWPKRLGPVETFFDRVAAARPAILLTAAGTLFLALSLPPLLRETSTFDEGIHLSAGYSYVIENDYRLNPEHPPLGKTLAALPVLFLRPEWPVDTEAWQKGSQWHLGYRFFYQEGLSRRLLIWGRIPALFWGLLIIGSVYAVSRELYGARGGLIALGLATACPTLLSHSHFVTTDVIVAALFLLTGVSFWKLYQNGTLRWCVYSGFLLGGALAAKFSAVLLLPIVLWLGVVAWMRRRPAIAIPAAMKWILHAAVVGIISLGTLWGAYGFRQRAATQGRFEFDWTRFEKTSGGLGTSAVVWARNHDLLPEAYVYGYLELQRHSTEGHPSFALGQYSSTGWWWYFPFGFLVKTPIASLLLMGWGLHSVWRRIREGRSGDEFIFVPAIVYWVIAVRTTINIGIRHLMPIYPLMWILAGGIEFPREPGGGGRRPGALAAILLAIAMVEGASAAPHFLAHFNLPSRILFERHEMLVDSNLDWGQDLGRLKEWMDREGIPSLKLSYFGHGSPRQLLLQHEVLPGNCTYPFFEPEWKQAGPLKPGDIVAISASNYSGFLLQDRDLYRRQFAGVKPLAVIGNSIIVFRVPVRIR